MVSLGETGVAMPYEGEETCSPAVGTLNRHFRRNLFMFNIFLLLIIKKKKGKKEKEKKICPPIQIHFMSPGPAHCGRILHTDTLIVMLAGQ